MICTRFKLKHTRYKACLNLKRNSWQLKNVYAYSKSFTCFIDEKCSGTYLASFPKSSTPVSLFRFISNILWIFQSLQLCQWGSELSFWAFKHTLFPDPGNNKFLDQQWLLILLQNLVAVIDGILYSAFQNERIKLLIDNCSLVSDICSTFTFCFFIYLWALCCSVLTACAEAARYRYNEVTND